MRDIRITIAIEDQKRNDTSFTEKGFFGIGPKYKQSEVREIWFQAMALGMEQGLMMASLEGQKIDITRNIKDEGHKEFYEKFLALSHQYNVAIQYHPQHGMCLIDKFYRVGFDPYEK